MSYRILQVLLVLVSIVAHSSQTSADSSCKRDAGEVARFLTTMDHVPTFLVVDQVDLVTRADLQPLDRPIEHGSVIVVRDQLRYLGDTVSATDLGKRLAAEFDRPKIAPDRTVILLVDRAARWELVHAALGAARTAKTTLLTFVFLAPVPTPPPRTKIDDELDTLKKENGGSLAPVIADFIRSKIKACPAMTALMKTASDAGPGDDSAAVMVAGVGAALIACNCAVEPGEIRSLFWAFLGNPHPLRAMSLTLDIKGKALDAPNDMQWIEVQKRLATSTTRLTFR